ncbi:MAG: glycerophosphodiester phosphodiesterase [bacterium]
MYPAFDEVLSRGTASASKLSGLVNEILGACNQQAKESDGMNRATQSQITSTSFDSLIPLSVVRIGIMNLSYELLNNEFLYFAHRGASAHEPENTLLSVEKALSLGASWIEIDLFVVENTLIVIHDETLERTTNGVGYVMEHSVDYLRSLDAGKGEPIPLLQEIFDLVNGRAGLNIEIKSAQCAPLLTQMIEHYVATTDWTYDHIIVSSSIYNELRNVRMLQPALKIGAIMDAYDSSSKRLLKTLNVFSMHVDHTEVSPKLVQKAHQSNLKVFVYTVNNFMERDLMKSMGVDGIFTDYPELAYDNIDTTLEYADSHTLPVLARTL